MNCEKCRWHKTNRYSIGVGIWLVQDACELGGCDGSQYEPREEGEQND